MKFKEMEKHQQDAIKDFLSMSINLRSQEEQRYVHEFYRLLVLGNGSGLYQKGNRMRKNKENVKNQKI